MAVLSAIHAVTGGLAQHLARAHQISPIRSTSCSFVAVGSTELKKLDGQDTMCSLFLHRISINEHVRNRTGAGDSRRPALSLNLHLLLTIWADSAQKEQLVFAWAMRELMRIAVLDRSILGSAASFNADELVQLSTEELSVDDMSRLWQMLAPPYRLSACFVARNVRIGYDDEETLAPVVASRFEVADELEGA